MLVKSIQLINFRNYNNFNIEFSPITVLVGNNGIGKSNIIEALGMLSYAKSYRIRDEINLINYEKKYAQIIANSKVGDINFVLSINDKGIKKEVKINDINEKIANIVGRIKTVLFTPESLKIITDSPGQRRKFLDIVLSEINSDYLLNLIRLKKIIKQRNELIKKIYEKKTKIRELIFWNHELSVCSRIIIEKRIDFINFLNKNISKLYQEISEKNNDKIKIFYETKIKDLSYIDDYITQILPREIDNQKTLIGPHLDDMKILINNKNSNMIASRGEIRSLIICLKILEIKYIEEETNEKILLLLDDVFSELDEKRRKKILNIIKDNQTIITTTKADFINKKINNIKIIKLYGQN